MLQGDNAVALKPQQTLVVFSLSTEPRRKTNTAHAVI
jgi:hypothetical protein